ncbi:MAG: hypothetical protein SH856_03135 [Flavobacteriales bacterium]|nr:hypothetical protein [Flavobacteriales bacterium]
MDFYWGFNQESAKKERTSVSKSASATSSSSSTVGNWVYTTTKTSTATASVEVLKISPDGYREFFVANEEADKSLPEHFKTGGIFFANRKMTSSLGYELCEGLGVDAEVVVYIVTRKLKKNKDDYAVNAMNMFMFGPNPLSEGGEDKNRGQFYCGSRIFYGSPLVFHNGKTNTPDFSGFDNALTALSKKTCNWVINKEKKIILRRGNIYEVLLSCCALRLLPHFRFSHRFPHIWWLL